VVEHQEWTRLGFVYTVGGSAWVVVLHSDGYQAGIGHLGHYGICNRMTRDEMSSRLERRFCM
jgi:hypothetical protein